MTIIILDKHDQNTVNKIIAIGYPENREHLNELLSWTCDPNWPIAASIYKYLRKLGKNEVFSVLKTAEKADYDWRYSLIIQVISLYDDDALVECIGSLRKWASQAGSNECDFESLRILANRKLIEASEVSHIAQRNVAAYNAWIKETLEAVGDL